jgi:hypothetical protein
MEDAAMAKVTNTGRGMFFGPGKQRESEGQRIIFCLANRLSLFLETKREVNRAIEELRLILRQRVQQRKNGRRIRAAAEEAKKEKGDGKG